MEQQVMHTDQEAARRRRAKFRAARPRATLPQDSESLFAALERSPKVERLWPHQAEILRAYHADHLKAPDIALELPTGSGKTLVGLLMAEYRRLAFDERVAYLCPTRQLARQVVDLAAQYGIAAQLLLPPGYEGINDYRRGAAVGVSTYSALFNNSPRVNDPQMIVLDDAHAAENFIVSPWSVSIERRQAPDLYEELVRIVGPALGGSALECLSKPDELW